MKPHLTRDQALAIETAEVEAWRDMYRAMPDSFRRERGTELIELDGVALTRSSTIPFVHFNTLLDLGLYSPASEATIDAAVTAYLDAGIAHFYALHHPFCLPEALPDWLVARGFQAKPGWDRVYRFQGGETPAAPADRGDLVFVDGATAATWGAFIDAWYRLPTSPWLAALVGRDGWRHAMLMRDGKPVATRSLFCRPGRDAWVGVEAPIPGLMAPSFADDHVLLCALYAEASRAGAKVVAADVEASNEARQGPAYERFAALGFSIAYHRAHYVHDRAS
jgi:hypothetical protein